MGVICHVARIMKYLSLLQKEFIKKSFEIVNDEEPRLFTDTHAHNLVRKTDVKATTDEPASRLTKDPKKEFKIDTDLEFQHDHQPVGVKQLNLKEKSKI
jgi:hypothetical protein